MSKELLLQEFAEAYDHLMETASLAAQRGVTQGRDGWGPREIVGHLAGWEVMARVRIPRIVAGMPPAEFTDPTQQTMMNDAINAAMVTLIGEQPLENLCDMLRHAYQRNIELLRSLDDTFFQPGDYVYERTKAVIEHCQEHMPKQLLTGRTFLSKNGCRRRNEPALTLAAGLLEDRAQWCCSTASIARSSCAKESHALFNGKFMDKVSMEGVTSAAVSPYRERPLSMM